MNAGAGSVFLLCSHFGAFYEAARVRLTFPTLAVEVNVKVDPGFPVVLFSFFCK